MKGRYKSAVDCVLLPAHVTLKRIKAERVELYRHITLPGEKIPVSIEPFQVEDSLPIENKIEWSAK